MKRLILFIGKDSVFRARTGGFLRAEGFYVEDAATGQEGVRKALSLHPDLILLDQDRGDAQNYDAPFWPNAWRAWGA